MNRLQDYALYDISWNLSPEHAVTMYLEWGNNDWHSEYPPVRSKEDVSHYFVVDRHQELAAPRTGPVDSFDVITNLSSSSKISLWFETSTFRGKREVDKTAEPMKSFFVTPPFREGQSARPLSVGCGVSRRTGRLWIETFPPQTHKPPHQTHQTGPRQRGPSSFGGPGYCHAIPARAVARGLFERGGGARWPVRIPARTEEPQRSGRPFASFPGRRT